MFAFMQLNCQWSLLLLIEMLFVCLFVCIFVCFKILTSHTAPDHSTRSYNAQPAVYYIYICYHLAEDVINVRKKNRKKPFLGSKCFMEWSRRNNKKKKYNSSF